MKDKKFQSRRATPWDNKNDRTPIEEFIVGCTRDNYDKRHIAPGDEREVSLLNSFVPFLCPKCGSGSIIKYGKTGVGLIRYKCKDCSGTFTVITGTIFDQRKISISQWLDFMVMIIGHGSFNLTSKINRNAFTTTKYWMDKLFLILEGWQESIMLEGDIYLDETYYPLMEKDTEKRPDGKGMRGLSRNKMCIGCAWDGKNLICIMEGFGKPSKKHTWESFSSVSSHQIRIRKPLKRSKFCWNWFSIIRKYCDIATKTAINAQNRRFSPTRCTKGLFLKNKTKHVIAIQNNG